MRQDITSSEVLLLLSVALAAAFYSAYCVVGMMRGGRQ